MFKTFQEIRQDLINRINAIQAPNTGYNFNVDPQDSTDLIAILVNAISEHIAEKQEMILKYRNSLNPLHATGEELRNVITYKGLTSKIGTRTTTTVTFNGTEGTFIPAGTQLQDRTLTKTFSTISDISIPSGLSASVIAECTQIGMVLLAENELFQLVNPIFGVNAITNTAGEVGTENETDEEIHLRVKNSTGAIGMGFLDVIDSALMNINGVSAATTYIHNETDFSSIPVGSICSVVKGGDDNEVAKVLLSKNLFFFDYYGNTTKAIKSEYLNRDYSVKFERPVNKNIGIALQVKQSANPLPDNLSDLLFEFTSTYLESKIPNSTIYISELITFLNSQNICFVIRGAIQAGTAIPTVFDNTTDSLKLSWNEVPNLAKANFGVSNV